MGKVVKILVCVRPLSRVNKLIIDIDGRFFLQVKAPPIKGKANREIIKWLSKKLRVSSKSISILKGLHSKEKTIGSQQIELNHLLRLNRLL